MAEIITLDPNYERLPAPHRQFNEVVVFVHHYGGHRHSFLSTMQWINDLGFDVVTFDLPLRNIKRLSRWPLDREWNFGLRHVWADKIEDVLGSIGQNKFVMSYSLPSTAALMAISRRHAIDIKGWICDGGPFKNIVTGIYNLVDEGKLIDRNSIFLRSEFVRKRIAEACAFVSGAWRHDQEMERALLALPKQFPILSVRAMKDSLVAPEQIDDYFKNTLGHVNLQKVELQNSGHLLGFKQETEIYKQYISGFLLHHATRV